MSTRTVRNDVERLRSLGYPVHATRGPVGGYRLGAGATLPPLILDDEEAVAVTIGLRTAAGGTITGVEETSLRAGQAGAGAAQPAPPQGQCAAEIHHAGPPDHPGPRVSAETLAVIAAACRDQEQLRFDYSSHDGRPSQRRVEPYRLVNWGRRWYLVAFDTDRADWRTFRADRITPRPPAGPRFIPRELPGDVIDHVKRGVASAAWRFRARVTVHAPAGQITDRINPAAGTVEHVDEGTCILDTGADTIETLAVYLSLLDADFTVTGPPELVAYLRVLSRRYPLATP